jgi:hypothetical protein
MRHLILTHFLTFLLGGSVGFLTASFLRSVRSNDDRQ